MNTTQTVNQRNDFSQPLLVAVLVVLILAIAVIFISRENHQFLITRIQMSEGDVTELRRRVELLEAYQFSKDKKQGATQ